MHRVASSRNRLGWPLEEREGRGRGGLRPCFILPSWGGHPWKDGIFIQISFDPFSNFPSAFLESRVLYDFSLQIKSSRSNTETFQIYSICQKPILGFPRMYIIFESSFDSALCYVLIVTRLLVDTITPLTIWYDLLVNNLIWTIINEGRGGLFESQYNFEDWKDDFLLWWKRMQIYCWFANKLQGFEIIWKIGYIFLR